MIRLFFATDVHGSEQCWKKFISGAKFYEAQVLILGGDMTGKAIVPIIAQANGKHKVTLLEQETMLDGPAEVQHMVETIQNRGYYPYLTTPDEVHEISDTPGRSDELFLQEALKTVERWMAYADQRLDGSGIRCYVCPGNDDVFEIDPAIAGSKTVRSVEGRWCSWTSIHEMASVGWSNPTPWQTHREEPDEALGRRIEAVVSQVKDPTNAVFNLPRPAVWQRPGRGARTDQGPAAGVCRPLAGPGRQQGRAPRHREV